MLTTITLLVPHEGRTVLIRFKVATQLLSQPALLGAHIAQAVAGEISQLAHATSGI